jgi:OOP family OmpA-OmpF porin
MAIHNITANKKLMSHLFKALSLVILLSASASYAQTRELGHFKKAEELYYSGNYFLAAKYYEHFLGYNTFFEEKTIKKAYISKLGKAKIRGGNAKDMALYRLAESYHKLPNYTLAEFYANKAATTLSSGEYPLAIYWYAAALKANGKIDESEKQFQQFIKTYSKKDRYLTNAQMEIQSFDFIRTQQQSQARPVIINKIPVDAEASYGLVKVQDGREVLFTSTEKKDTSLGEVQYHTSVYEARMDEEKLTDISQLLFGHSEDLLHYGEAILNKDGNYLFFTGIKMISGISKSAIYMSKREGDKWGNPVMVDGNINVSGSNSRQPMLTKDGGYLFFSSDRPGGQGKYDIWLVPLDINYKPGKVANAGKVINTPEDESNPFYHDNSNTLFFSSKGKIGIGGFDIYKAEGSIGKWKETANLGSPYNSTRDDLYFFSSHDADFKVEAYFSSDRNTDCCLELFKATAPQTSRVVEIIPENSVEKIQGIDSLTVYFDFDESKPSKDYIDALSLFAKQITDKFFEIRIGGFTDGLGTADYNMALAKRRIESCIKVLNENGIEREHFVITVGGECCPVVKEIFEDGTDNPEARIRNRRVTIKLIK